MTKPKTIKRSLLIILISLGIFGLIAIALQKSNLGPQRMPALVTNLHSNPNLAEDGYIGATIRSLSGQSYKINMTGFLNTPYSFSLPIDCLPEPSLRPGDVVIINLPKDKYQSNTFTTCYDKDESGYFIKVIHTGIVAVVIFLALAVFMGWRLWRRQFSGTRRT